MEHVACRYKPASHARAAKTHMSGAWGSWQAVGVVALGVEDAVCETGGVGAWLFAMKKV